ncbi:hypothetical protein [Haloplanus halobius]|uniref:hypothetical protein n=1 Tax=Haloplanus halobius TaxID=2934938 RepID=UPI00200FEFB7|nr:hypothetical protein [Haloplanus sp. XH21]
MRRRAFLGSVGLAALAGCSTGNDTTATPTSTPTSTPPGGGSPAFELIGVQSPESLALNVPGQFRIGVKNTGSGKGTFTTPLESKYGEGEWKKSGTIEMPLSPGETGEWRSPSFTGQYLTPFHFRLPEFDRTWTVEVTPKELDFGKQYASPNGFILNVLGGSFESTYPTSGNETATNETTPTPTSPGDGETWAVMQLEVRNRLQEAQTTPDPSTFVLTVNGEQRPQHQEVSDDPYDGSELAGRTIRRDDLVYAVPEGTQARDLTLTWEASLSGGDVKAIWSK